MKLTRANIMKGALVSDAPCLRLENINILIIINAYAIILFSVIYFCYCVKCVYCKARC